MATYCARWTIHAITGGRKLSDNVAVDQVELLVNGRVTARQNVAPFHYRGDEEKAVSYFADKGVGCSRE